MLSLILSFDFYLWASHKFLHVFIFLFSLSLGFTTLRILPAVCELLKFVKHLFFPSLCLICHRERMFMTNPRFPLLKPRDRLRPYPNEWELQTRHRSCTR